MAQHRLTAVLFFLHLPGKSVYCYQPVTGGSYVYCDTMQDMEDSERCWD